MSRFISVFCTFFLSVALSACTTNTVVEEQFEGPSGDFPHLVDVPDRPLHVPLNQESTISELEARRIHSSGHIRGRHGLRGKDGLRGKNEQQ